MSNVIEEGEVIYIDYSTFSTFQTCQERARLRFRKHLRSITERPALSFGAAFHEAVAEFNRCKSVSAAQTKFIQTVQERNADLPLSSNDDEKRSIERGLALLNHYIAHYRNEPFDVLPDHIEVGFAVFLMEWHGRPVMYVGKIDSIKKSRTDGRNYNFELKTTGQSLSQYLKQVRPNHQITGYHWAANLLGLDVAGTYWDAVYVSDRKPGGKFSDGVDPDKDFGRQITYRSHVDIKAFVDDLIFATDTYLRLAHSGVERWSRNAPTACNMYGGCEFREVCSTNLNEQVVKSNFKVEQWMPWEGILRKGVTKVG